MKVIALLVCLLLATVASASDVTDLTPDNFDSKVFESDKASFVEFFAPWVCIKSHHRIIAALLEISSLI